MTIKRRYFLLILSFYAVLLFGCAGGSGDSFTGDSGEVLFVTDLHFNPFDDPLIFNQLDSSEPEDWSRIIKTSTLNWGSYGRATTPWMFLSILDHLKKNAAQADFVVFLGDVLAHHFDQTYFDLSGTKDRVRLEKAILKTYRYFYLSLAEALPGKTIIFTLGNNDYYCGDYQVQPNGPFLSDLSKLTRHYLGLDQFEQNAFDKTFTKGGYYAMAFPGLSDQRLIVLNAIFFSNNYTNRCGSGSDIEPGREELTWLETQLKDARKNQQSVWLMLHIPPGLNIYGTIHDHLIDGRIDQVEDFWRAEFHESMQMLLTEYSDILTVTFSGHTHMDDFRLGPSIGPINKIVPALSPVFDNNPGFILASYNVPSLEVTDYRTIYIDLPANQSAVYGQEKWLTEYDYLSTYQVGGLNPTALARLHQKIYNQVGAHSDYKIYYDVSNVDNQPMFDQDHFLAYWCGQSYWNEDDFLRCYNSH